MGSPDTRLACPGAGADDYRRCQLDGLLACHIRRYGVWHEHERPRLLSLITGSSACAFAAASLGKPAATRALGPAAPGAGPGPVYRAIGRGRRGGMMTGGDE